MITAISGVWLLMWRRTSKPSAPGTMMSSTAASKWCCFSKVMASSPLTAGVTWKPEMVMYSFNTSRMVGSSSKNRMRYCMGWGPFLGDAGGRPVVVYDSVFIISLWDEFRVNFVCRRKFCMLAVRFLIILDENRIEFTI